MTEDGRRDLRAKILALFAPASPRHDGFSSSSAAALPPRRLHCCACNCCPSIASCLRDYRLVVMSKQGNLDSFFGVAKEKRIQKQSKLSFASKPKTCPQDNNATDKEQEGKKEQDKQQEQPQDKENTTNHSSQDDLMDTDDEGTTDRKRIAASQKSPDETKRSKRAILEDSEDEEEFQPPNEESNDDEDEEMEEAEEPKKPAAKQSANVALQQPKKSSSSKPSKGAKKSELAALAMKTDEALLQNETVTWKDHVPYAAICETFEAIEEISGRLEIQEKLTELFRRVLLRNPQDMYHLIYLASNTVAPAYECVELGVGDSILIKAIGGAYGTDASE